MPQQQSKQPDFIPAQQSTPDFIPADSGPPPDTQKMSGNTGMFGGLQDSFDENTKTDPKEPLLETGLKSVVGAIGQPFVHPVGTVTGMAKSLRHPLDEAHQEVNDFRANPAYEGTKMAGNLFGNVALGGAAGAAPGFVGDVADAIPTRAKAGKIFSSLDTDLANHPVPLNKTMAPLQRVTEIGVRGSQLPKAVSDLLTRSQSPIDMTFPEARDYQSSLSDLSANDKMSMGGRVKGGVSQLSKGFYDDLHDAATQAGRGDDYANAMSQYRRAATTARMAKNAAKWGGGAVAAAAGLQGAKSLIDAVRK